MQILIHPQTHAHIHRQDHYSSYIAREKHLYWQTITLQWLCVFAAESESTGVPMMDEMSLLQESVAPNSAAEASSFIDPSFIHTEPSECNVGNVHTLKLNSFSKPISINCL